MGSAGSPELLRVGGDALVVVNDLGDYEVKPLLRERGIEVGVFGKGA